jgi:hypothetical protein
MQSSCPTIKKAINAHHAHEATITAASGGLYMNAAYAARRMAQCPLLGVSGRKPLVVSGRV